MLPFPAGGGLLLPAKAQLSSALPKYRELLRKTRTGTEESSRCVSGQRQGAGCRVQGPCLAATRRPPPGRRRPATCCAPSCPGPSPAILPHL